MITFLASSPQTFWPSTEQMPNPFVRIVILRSTASQELDCYTCSAILHCLLLVNFSVSFPGRTLEFQLGYSLILHHISGHGMVCLPEVVVDPSKVAFKSSGRQILVSQSIIDSLPPLHGQKCRRLASPDSPLPCFKSLTSQLQVT